MSGGDLLIIGIVFLGVATVMAALAYDDDDDEHP